MKLDEAAFRVAVYHSLTEGDERMQRIEHELIASRAVLDSSAKTTDVIAVRERTDEMVEMFMAMKGGFKVLGWMGQLVKWAAPIIAAVAAARHAGSSWWPFH